MTVFNPNRKTKHTESKMFLDKGGSVDIQRFDTLKYKQFDKLTDKQLGFFWRPEEVDILRDATDFKNLSDHEQHIFTSNLKRQILLDSVQGRSPNLAFLPIVTLPELETWIETLAFSETIHSRSYTHIIRNVYADPSKVFDEMLDVKEIVDCADSITANYDKLIEYNLLRQQASKKYDEYEHKKALWLALMSVNILEGVRFYVSFACSWAFAELKKMEGNAKIIKLIARDENVHLASTQQMLKLLPREDKDFEKIQKETYEECTKLFLDASRWDGAGHLLQLSITTPWDLSTVEPFDYWDSASATSNGGDASYSGDSDYWGQRIIADSNETDGRIIQSTASTTTNPTQWDSYLAAGTPVGSNPFNATIKEIHSSNDSAIASNSSSQIGNIADIKSMFDFDGTTPDTTLWVTSTNGDGYNSKVNMQWNNTGDILYHVHVNGKVTQYDCTEILSATKRDHPDLAFSADSTGITGTTIEFRGRR